jgi:hypothetical protein
LADLSRLLDLLPFGRPTDEPLTSARTVSRWIDSLPLGDAFASQEKVVAELARFNQKLDKFSRENLAVLMQVDVRARELQHILCQQYLRNPRMSRALESRLWNAIYNYYWEAARGYHAFLMDYVAHPAGHRIKPQLPLVTARALRLFAELFKWRYLRYAAPDARMWQRLHNLYRVSEYEGFETQPVQLYDSEAKPCTAQALYLRPLLLSLANTGALYPRHIDLVDQWLAGWSPHVPLSSQYQAEQHAFCVNTAEGAAPARLRNPTPNSACRYFGAATLMDITLRTREALKSGAAPAQLGLTEHCRVPECFELLDGLARQWTPAARRDQRRAVRERVKKAVEVLHGLGNIVHRLRPRAVATHSPYGRADEEQLRTFGFVTQRAPPQAAEPRPQGAIERWIVENESPLDFGAQLPAQENDWLRLGALVAAREHREEIWHIGRVRRLAATSDNQRQAGVELFPGAPSAVLLRPHRESGAGAYMVDGVDAAPQVPASPALLLSDKDGATSLLIEAGQYASLRQFDARLPEGDAVLQLRQVLDKGDDWLRVAVEVERPGPGARGQKPG